MGFLSSKRPLSHTVLTKSFIAQRAVINLVSNADAMISNFEAAFGELKIALILGSSLQTTLVSYRILQAVENIGKPSRFQYTVSLV